MPDLIGQPISHYHILDRLGEGGMAIVYKAYDTRLERDVAVKVIRTEKLTLETMSKTLKRFEREAKALAKLTHPNIVPITDYGEYDDKPYLVMSYIPGGTLKKRLTGSEPIYWQESARLLAPIARALEHARHCPPGCETIQHPDHGKRPTHAVGFRRGKGTPGRRDH
jgi:serine/threonine protein kinase